MKFKVRHGFSHSIFHPLFYTVYVFLSLWYPGWVCLLHPYALQRGSGRGKVGNGIWTFYQLGTIWLNFLGLGFGNEKVNLDRDCYTGQYWKFLNFLHFDWFFIISMLSLRTLYWVLQFENYFPPAEMYEASWTLGATTLQGDFSQQLLVLESRSPWIL